MTSPSLPSSGPQSRTLPAPPTLTASEFSERSPPKPTRLRPEERDAQPMALAPDRLTLPPDSPALRKLAEARRTVKEVHEAARRANRALAQAEAELAELGIKLVYEKGDTDE